LIAVDTSALMAILLNEPDAAACADLFEREDLVISAATLAEALIVASRRNLGAEMRALIDGLAIEVVPVSHADAIRAAAAHARWGKGTHPAALNYGDCFSYVLATGRGIPLAFVGTDFSRTDVAKALQ
jgi:ribonuclease VapC